MSGPPDPGQPKLAGQAHELALWTSCSDASELFIVPRLEESLRGGEAKIILAPDL